jgi:hypothetical protein
MDFAPPPEPGSRVQELGDRLIVCFRPRRAWGSVGFLTFWLLLWTVGGIAAIGHAITEADSGARIFLSLWLCGWAVGMVAVTSIIAWLLVGREFLAVTPEILEVRKEIGRFARVKRYDAARVRDVTAERFPTDEGERPRTDFCLIVRYAEATVRIGEGMGEHEAEYVASLVLSRLRPAARWSDRDRDERFAARANAMDVRDPPSALRRALVVTPSIAFTAILVGAIVMSGSGGGGDETRTSRSPAGPPLREDFSNDHDYAVASARYSLSGAIRRPHGGPQHARVHRDVGGVDMYGEGPRGLGALCRLGSYVPVPLDHVGAAGRRSAGARDSVWPGRSAAATDCRLVRRLVPGLQVRLQVPHELGRVRPVDEPVVVR